MVASYPKSKGRGHTKRFAMLSYPLLDSDAWKSLTPHARSVFTALLRQYNGGNNGNLSYTKKTAKRQGLSTSGTTMRKAMDELWKKGFIKLTRQGSFGSTQTCNLWAVTTWPIDDFPAEGIKATSYASDLWRQCTKGRLSPNYVDNFPAVAAARKKRTSKKSRVTKMDRTGHENAPGDPTTGVYPEPVAASNR